MIHNRHPEVAATMVRGLSGPTDMRHFTAVASCRVELRASGCNIPEWEDLPTALPRALAALVPGVGHSRGRGGNMTFLWSRAALRGNCGRPFHFSGSSGHAPVARRSSLWPPVHHSAHHTPPQVRVSPVQGPPSSSPPPSSPIVLSRLPVWPSTRLLWPPPRKLLEGRGPWEAWLRIGVCSGARLPRGKRQSLRECVLARPRPSRRCHGSAPDRGDR